MANGKTVTVQSRECVDKIAFDCGLTPDGIWLCKENGQLRETRKEKNILAKGDAVFIPPKTLKIQSIGCNTTHRFKRIGVPAFFEARFLDEDNLPRADVPFTCWIDGEWGPSGETDRSGRINVPISPGATEIVFTLGREPDDEEYIFALGELDPHDQNAGVQQRLLNLGYEPGPVDGIIGPVTAAALRGFQYDQDLPPTGEVDAETKLALRKHHES